MSINVGHKNPAEDHGDISMLDIARRTIFYLAAHYDRALCAAMEKGEDHRDPAQKVNLTLVIENDLKPVLGIQITLRRIEREFKKSFGTLLKPDQLYVLLRSSLVSKIIRNIDDDLRTVIIDEWMPAARRHFLLEIESQEKYDLLEPFNTNMDVLEEQIRTGQLPKY